MLTEQQKADLTNTAIENASKLKEIKHLVQNVLWSNSGANDVFTSLEVAESECKLTAAVDRSTKQEAYDFMLNHLQDLTKTAKGLHDRWKRWIPSDQKRVIQDRLRELDLTVPVLVSMKAEFIQVKLKEEDKRQTWTAPLNPTMPTIRLKPIALPKFSGVKRDFHRWRKDWEALQS